MAVGIDWITLFAIRLIAKIGVPDISVGIARIRGALAKFSARDGPFMIDQNRLRDGARAPDFCWYGVALEASERIRLGQMTVIVNRTGPDLDWSVKGFLRQWDLRHCDWSVISYRRLSETERSIGCHCRFPAIENGLWVSRSVDQGNFIQHETSDRRRVAGLAPRDAPPNGKTSIHLISYFGHRHRVDDMGDNAGSTVLAHLGFERCSGSGELMHFSKSGETHIVGDRCTNGVGSHDFSLFVHGLGCRDPVHPHGPVVLRLDLLDCAVKPHNSKSQSDIGISHNRTREPCGTEVMTPAVCIAPSH